MNRRQRFICQALVLWLLGVTAIAVSDYVDQENYERQKDVDATKLAAVSTVREVKPQSERVQRFELHQGGSYQPRESYIEETIVKEQVYESLEIPQGDCSSFLYMDYRAITDTSSKQWELQQYAYDGDYGIREVDDYYCVAVSSIYGNVGDKIKVTTDRGNSYWCIIADIKGYDSVNGWYHVNSQGTINLIEFVVNGDLIPNECWQFGDMGIINNLGGNIIEIQKEV